MGARAGPEPGRGRAARPPDAARPGAGAGRPGALGAEAAARHEHGRERGVGAAELAHHALVDVAPASRSRLEGGPLHDAQLHARCLPARREARDESWG